MITSRVYDRVLRLECEATRSQGTGFTIDVDDRQYLVTAKHLLPDDLTVVVRLRKHGDLALTRIPIIHQEADVAVFPLDKPLTNAQPVRATTDQIVVGQDLYLLGYPHGLSTNAFADADEIPLIKKGILSAMLADNDDGFRMFLLDGFVNEGMSGGPVAYLPFGVPFHVARDTADQRIAGVISGYFPEDVGQPEGWNVRANSGIVTMLPIDVATKSIEAARG